RKPDRAARPPARPRDHRSRDETLRAWARVRPGEPAAMPRIAWSPEQIAAHEAELAKRPHFSRLNHISIPVTDLEAAKRFYVGVLGGRLIRDGTPHFSEVLVAGTVVGLSDVRGTPQRSDAEFPHLGFEIESEHFLPMKAWLEENGVKTHAPWTRHHVEGLMY